MAFEVASGIYMDDLESEMRKNLFHLKARIQPEMAHVSKRLDFRELLQQVTMKILPEEKAPWHQRRDVGRAEQQAAARSNHPVYFLEGMDRMIS